MVMKIVEVVVVVVVITDACALGCRVLIVGALCDLLPAGNVWLLSECLTVV